MNYGLSYRKICFYRHLIAAALKAKVDILLTLDKRDFFTSRVKNYVKPMQIMTPKDIINRYLKV